MLYAQFIIGIAGLTLISGMFIRFDMGKHLIVLAATVTATVGLVVEIALHAASPYYNPWYAILVICGCYAAILSIVYGFLQHFRLSGRKDSQAEIQNKAIILAFWVIGPPVWFAIDYFLIFNPSRLPKDPGVFEQFKYGQDVASKAWLALVTLLTGLYFGKDFTPSEPTDNRSATDDAAIGGRSQTTSTINTAEAAAIHTKKDSTTPDSAPRPKYGDQL